MSYEWKGSAHDWRRLLWGLRVNAQPSGGPPLAVFRGITVDKL